VAVAIMGGSGSSDNGWQWMGGSGVRLAVKCGSGSGSVAVDGWQWQCGNSNVAVAVDGWQYGRGCVALCKQSNVAMRQCVVMWQ
jgi:hypothetical protein